MAKITIVGDSFVVTSTATLEQIKMLEKYNKKALSLVEKNEDGVKEELFKVASTTGRGSINAYGASFGSTTHDDARFATITMEIPAGTVDAVGYVAEKYGAAIIALNKVETQFAAAIAGVAAQKAEVLANITVAG